jgi:hypothetical protein
VSYQTSRGANQFWNRQCLTELSVDLETNGSLVFFTGLLALARLVKLMPTERLTLALVLPMIPCFVIVFMFAAILVASLLETTLAKTWVG